MKKFFVVALFLVVLSAGAFIPQMSFQVRRDVAIVRVFNQTYYPAVCSGQAFGYTYSGLMLNAWMNNMAIYPGQWVDLYVYTNYYDPFVNANASIFCNH